MLVDFPAPEPREEPYDVAEHFWLRYPYYSKEYADEVLARFEDHIERWETSSVGSAIWACYRAYHNLDSAKGGQDPLIQIQSAGDVGEFLSLSVNHVRGLVKHQIALVTKDRPAWDPQARTSDADAAKQVRLARNILDYTMTAKRFDALLAEQFEAMKVCGSAFLVQGWDQNAGLQGEGSIWGKVLMPWEVGHERVRHYDDCTWWQFRVYESRWDWATRLAASDPEAARKLANLDPKASKLSYAFADDAADSQLQPDRIAVIITYARPTIACPQGRLSYVAVDGTVLLDGPMPYGNEPPIRRLASAQFLGTSTPYADAWSLLPLAEAYNAIVSMALTRVDTCGVPSFAAPDGSDFEASDLTGNKMLRTPPGTGDVKVLDFLRIPSELIGLMNTIKQSMEELSGINSVTRGQPTENISSGSMAALLQSMAVQFNSADERNWIFNLEAVATDHLRIYQRMATERQLISICGQDNQWTVGEFQAEDLEMVTRIAVKAGNAMSKTLAGRVDMADKLLERQMLKTPAEYMRIVDTGELQTTFRGPVDELTFIKSENEDMARGNAAKAVIWDNHELHVREHKGELTTQLRSDPKRLELVMGHLQEHMLLWSQLSREQPDILAAMGVEPLPMAAMIGQQAMAAEAAAMPGMPPPGEPPEGPSPEQQPNTEPKRDKPGPKPEPKGRNAASASPRLPEPARTPGGEPVV